MLIKMINFGIKEMPERAHYNDAGADVRLLEDVVINGRGIKKIPLGFGLEIPDGFAGFIMPKSGLSSKGLVTEMSPIDSGYRGEIHAIVTNHSEAPQILKAGDKIGQLVIFPIVLAQFSLQEDLFNQRGDGAFGSTGK